MGPYKFVFQADAPDPRRIPTHDVLGVTVILLSCFYHEKARAYHVHTMCIPCAYHVHGARTQRARGTRTALAANVVHTARTPHTWRTHRMHAACTPRARGARAACALRGAPRAGEVVRIGCACVTPLNPEPEPNREQEFIRIGYYVNTEYDAPELMEAPPEQIQVRARVSVRVRVSST